MKGYIALAMSIVTEVFATSMLKLSSGFTILLPSVGVIVGYAISFFLLAVTLRTISLSMAYAIWSGVGTALTALVGVLVWDELFNTVMLGGIVLIIAGVIFLNVTTNDGVTREASE